MNNRHHNDDDKLKQTQIATTRQCETLLQQITEIQQQLHETTTKRQQVQTFKNRLLIIKQNMILNKNLILIKEKQSQLQSVQHQILYHTKQLQQLNATNCLNSVFDIEVKGVVGMINQLKLGFLLKSSSSVSWEERNGALGQVAFLLYLLQYSYQDEFSFSDYELIYQGSYSKIMVKANKVIYNLYYSEDSFQFFARRNFNTALGGLLKCLNDAAEFVQYKDRTMAFPFSINVDKMTIGGSSFLLNSSSSSHSSSDSDDEEWTRACKCFLTNLKWFVAFHVKHHHFA